MTCRIAGVYGDLFIFNSTDNSGHFCRSLSICVHVVFFETTHTMGVSLDIRRRIKHMGTRDFRDVQAHSHRCSRSFSKRLQKQNHLRIMMRIKMICFLRGGFQLEAEWTGNFFSHFQKKCFYCKMTQCFDHKKKNNEYVHCVLSLCKSIVVLYANP